MPMFLPTGVVSDMPADLIDRVRNPYYRNGIPDDQKARSKRKHEEKVRESDEKRKKRAEWLFHRNDVQSSYTDEERTNNFVGYCDWNMMSYYGGIKELDPQFPLTPTCCEACNDKHGSILPIEEQTSPELSTSYDKNGTLKVEPILDQKDPEDNIVLSSNYGPHIQEPLCVTIIGLLPKNADDLQNVTQWSFNEWFDKRYVVDEPTKVACLFLSGQVNYTLYYTDDKGILQTKDKHYGFYDKLWSKQYFSVYNDAYGGDEWHQGDDRFHPRFKDIMRNTWVYTWEPMRSPDAFAYRFRLGLDRTICVCSHWGGLFGIDFYTDRGNYACRDSDIEHETVAPHLVFQNQNANEAFNLKQNNNQYLTVTYKQENDNGPVGWTRMANSPVLNLTGKAVKDALIVTPLYGDHAFHDKFNNALHSINEWDIWRQYVRKHEYTLENESGETEKVTVERIRYIPGMLLNDGTRIANIKNFTPDPEHVNLDFEWLRLSENNPLTVAFSGTLLMSNGQDRIFSEAIISWTLTQEVNGTTHVTEGVSNIVFNSSYVRPLESGGSGSGDWNGGYQVYLGAGVNQGTGQIIGAMMEGCTSASVSYTIKYSGEIDDGEYLYSKESETITAEVHIPNGDLDEQIARNRWKLRKAAEKYKRDSERNLRKSDDDLDYLSRDIIDDQFVESTLSATQTLEETVVPRPSPQNDLVLNQIHGVTWAEQIQEGEHRGKYRVRKFVDPEIYVPFKINIRIREWDGLFRKHLLERCRAHYSFTSEKQDDINDFVFDLSDGAYSHNWIGVDVPWEYKDQALGDILPVDIDCYGTCQFSLKPNLYHSIYYDDDMLTVGLLGNNGSFNNTLPPGSRWGVLGYNVRGESDLVYAFPFDSDFLGLEGFERCSWYNTRILSYEAVDNATRTPTLVPFREAFSLPMDRIPGNPTYLNLFINDPEEKDVLARISFPVEFRQALVRDNRSIHDDDRYDVSPSFGGAIIPAFAQYYESYLNETKKQPYFGAKPITKIEEPFFKVIDESQYNFEDEEEEE